MPSPHYVLVFQPMSLEQTNTSYTVYHQHVYIGRHAAAHVAGSAEYRLYTMSYRPVSRQTGVGLHPGYQRFFRRQALPMHGSIAGWDLTDGNGQPRGQAFLYRKDSIRVGYYPDGWVWSPSTRHQGERPVFRSAPPPPPPPRNPRFNLDRVYAIDAWKDG